jgi:predicted MFS family arabinose efflux permease
MDRILRRVCGSLFSSQQRHILPVLYNLAKDLNITLTMANLSITASMVVSRFRPSLLGDLADNLGRRPLYIGAMLVCTIANIGLATQ